MTSDPFDHRCWRCSRPLDGGRLWLCSECFQRPAGVPWWRRLVAALAIGKAR